MSTITTLTGVEWYTIKHNSYICYKHNVHIISFDEETKEWQLINSGQVIFSNKEVSKCLEEGSKLVLDYYSNKIKALWEQ
jgi:hypothetical protein